MIFSFSFSQEMGNTHVPMPVGPPGLQVNRVQVHHKRAVRSGLL